MRFRPVLLLALALLSATATDRTKAAASSVPLVSSISPTGAGVDPATQIRIVFSKDLVPLGSLASPARADVLAHVHVSPPQPGRFEILTPRMIVFSADAPLPHPERIEVSLDAGLHDLAGDALARSVVATFETAPAVISSDIPNDDVDGSNFAPQPLDPSYEVDSDAPLDLASLETHAHLRDAAGSDVPLTIVPAGAPGSAFTISPARTLAKDTKYRFTLDAGTIVSGTNVTAPPYEAVFRTYAPLRFSSVERYDAGTDRGSGRFRNGSPQLVFNNPIDPIEVARHIHVDAPLPPGEAPLRLEDGDASAAVSLNAVLMQPGATYDVTLDAKLTDRFGQQLGHEQHVAVGVGPYEGELVAPDGRIIVRANGDARIRFRSRNLIEPDPLRAIVEPFTAADAVRFPALDPQNYAVLRSDALAWPDYRVGNVPNRFEEHVVSDGPRSDGEAVAFGVNATTELVKNGGASPSPEQRIHVGTVERTNIGLFAETFYASAIARTHRIDTAAPIAGARIDFYEVPTGPQVMPPPNEPAPCASATTDATGTANLGRSAISACREPGSRRLVVIARDGADWTYLTSDQSGRGAIRTFDPERPGSPIGTLAFDRSYYEPGDVAHVTLIAERSVDGRIVPETTPFQLEYQDGGPGRRLRDVTPDADGFASFTVPVSTSPASQGIDLTAYSKLDGRTYDATASIDTGRRPQFTSSFGADRHAFATGEGATLTVNDRYFFGAPVSGARVTFSARRIRNPVIPRRAGVFEDFTFLAQPPFFGFFRRSDGPAMTFASSATDEHGSASVRFVPSPAQSPGQYEVEAQSVDPTNTTVKEHDSFEVLPGARIPGTRIDHAEAGAPLKYSFIVVDPSESAVPSTPVEARLERLTEHADGLRYDVTDSARLVSGSDPAAATFATPLVPGSYQLVLTAIDDARRPATTTEAFEVVAPGPPPSPGPSAAPQPSLEILDSGARAPGSDVHARLHLPVDGDAVVGIVREGELVQQTHVAGRGDRDLTFRLDAAMAPSTIVEALIVDRTDGARPLAVLNAGFSIDDPARTLALTIAAPARTEPGARVTLHVRLRDAAGRGMPARALVQVVDRASSGDDGSLQGLASQLAPGADAPSDPASADVRDDLADAVAIPERDQSNLNDEDEFIRQEQLLGQTVDAYAVPGRLRSIGRTSARPSNVVALRKLFRALAYDDASIRTDANGEATLSFTLPDNVTTWFVRAFALAPGGRAAYASQTFQASRPLLVTPALPAFVRPGDEVIGGALLTRSEQAPPSSVRIDMRLGSGLAFASSDRSLATRSVNGSGSAQLVRFDFHAAGKPLAADAAVAVRARAPGLGDAFEVKLPFDTRGGEDTVAESGTTTYDAAVPLDLASVASGRLEAELAPSLYGEFVPLLNARDLEEWPDSRNVALRIRILSDIAVLDHAIARATEERAARTQLTEALSELTPYRTAAGTYDEFAPAPTRDGIQPGVGDATFAVVEALLRAKAADVPVDDELHRLRDSYAAASADFTAGHCNVPDCDEGLFEVPSFDVAETFVRLGASLPPVEAGLCGGPPPPRLDWPARRALAAARIPGCAAFARAALREFETKSIAGSRGDTLDSDGGAFLEFALAMHESRERIDRLARGLVARQRNGGRRSLDEDADELDALAAYARLAEKTRADFIATTTIGSVRFVDRLRSSDTIIATHAVPIASARGAGELRFSKRGTGTLYYSVELHEDVPADAPGRYAGLRIDRIVHAGGVPAPLAAFGPGSARAVAAREGDVYAIDDRIATDHPIDDVVIDDPTPAGFEAIDDSFATSSLFEPDRPSWALDARAILRGHVTGFAHHLDPGVYALRYLVRAAFPGRYAWPGATVYQARVPEDFGRTAAGSVAIERAP